MEASLNPPLTGKEQPVGISWGLVFNLDDPVAFAPCPSCLGSFPMQWNATWYSLVSMDVVALVAYLQ